MNSRHRDIARLTGLARQLEERDLLAVASLETELGARRARHRELLAARQANASAVTTPAPVGLPALAATAARHDRWLEHRLSEAVQEIARLSALKIELADVARRSLARRQVLELLEARSRAARKRRQERHDEVWPDT